MRKSFFPGTTGIFALFFVPYIVTIIFNGANTTLINKKFNVEMLLPVIVSSQIEDKYEKNELTQVNNITKKIKEQEEKYVETEKNNKIRNQILSSVEIEENKEK